MSDSGKTSFKDAYRTYMDFSTGMVGKTLIVFKNAKSITECVFDPKNVHLRIKIQSSYVPGPKAKDVAAEGYVGQDNCIQIWETKQATRNFELATKTAVFKSDNSTLASDKQPASITLLSDGPSISSGVADPTGGFVSVSGQYKIFQDYSVRQMGVLVGYCPINFSGDSVHKTEGWGSVLVSKGYQEAAAW
jgi:predicted transport protein